jgi:hypothetical protein
MCLCFTTIAPRFIVFVPTTTTNACTHATLDHVYTVLTQALRAAAESYNTSNSSTERAAAMSVIQKGLPYSDLDMAVVTVQPIMEPLAMQMRYRVEMRCVHRLMYITNVCTLSVYAQ